MIKKNNKHTSFQNNLYLLKLVFKASPLRVPLESLFHISKGLIQTLIYTVLFGTIINSVASGYSYTQILIYISITAAITGCSILFQSWFQEAFIQKDNVKLKKYMLCHVFSHASSLNIQLYENPEFYDNYIRCLEEANQRAMKLSNSIAATLGLLSTVLYLLYIIVSKEPTTLIFVLIPLVPGWLLGNKKNQVIYELYKKNTNPERWIKYLNRIMYLPEYAKEIRLTNIYPTLSKKYNATMDEIISNEKKYDKKSTLLTLLMDFMNDKLIYVGILLYISYLIIVKKKLLVGDYIIIQNAVASMTWRISALINSSLDLQQSGKFISLLREFMETETSTNENGIKESPLKFAKKIEFKNVSFSYDNMNNVINNINVEINKDKKILIVGKNGAGKSTFVKLLMNLYSPTSGEILYDGKNISNFDLPQYTQIYSTIFQDFCLYALNVGENIVLNEIDDVQKERIQESIRKAELSERIDKLPKGIYTEVTKEINDDGFVPSGGEEQKIAISRVIYKDSDIVILDEPSSALDPISESKINELMLKAAQGKTVIMISHRLSSAKLADEILFFENGKITEKGSHDELIKLNGEYARMFRMQEEQYDLGGEDKNEAK